MKTNLNTPPRGILAFFLICSFFFQQSVSGQESAPADSHESPDWLVQSEPNWVLHYTPDDSTFVGQFKVQLRLAQEKIADFFDTSWSHPFDIYLFPNRAALDRQWQQDWHLPDFHSECWMVASGVGKRLDFLSLKAWPTEACEHNPQESVEWRRILAHELTHVFHGQHNPEPDFDGLDNIGWFIEGLAIVVSGQYDSSRQADALEAVAKGAVPDTLSQLWSGRYRYAVCGSLVNFIDRSYGRVVTRKLLSCNTQAQILAVLNVTESALLKMWRDSVYG